MTDRANYLNTPVIEITNLDDRNTTKFARSRGQTNGELIRKNTRSAAPRPFRGVSTPRNVPIHPDPSGMTNTHPMPLSACITEVLEHLGCSCDPRHLAVGGFDHGCPTHDPKETR